MSVINFKKYQGLGNDFIVIDCRDSTLKKNIFYSDKPFVKKVCDRNFGIGADGILLLLESTNNSIARMEIINSDGSIPEMCGNGIRCLVRYIKDNTDLINNNEFYIQTLAGNIKASLTKEELITIDMGIPRLSPQNIPTTLTIDKTKRIPSDYIDLDGNNETIYAVGMGNPHMIVILKSIAEIPLEIWGKRLENHQDFPNNTNVHFAEIIDSNTVKVKTWERGCGVTKACGTGACSVLTVTSILEVTKEKANIILPGGTLHISWPLKKGSIFMTGPADYVFDGCLKYND